MDATKYIISLTSRSIIKHILSQMWSLPLSRNSNGHSWLQTGGQTNKQTNKRMDRRYQFQYNTPRGNRLRQERKTIPLHIVLCHLIKTAVERKQNINFINRRPPKYAQTNKRIDRRYEFQYDTPRGNPLRQERETVSLHIVLCHLIKTAVETKQNINFTGCVYYFAFYVCMCRALYFPCTATHTLRRVSNQTIISF